LTDPTGLRFHLEVPPDGGEATTPHLDYASKQEMASIDVIIVGFGQNHQSKAFIRSCLTTFGRDLEDEAD
jgi:hypothetical protein